MTQQNTVIAACNQPDIEIAICIILAAAFGKEICMQPKNFYYIVQRPVRCLSDLLSFYIFPVPFRPVSGDPTAANQSAKI